MTYNRTLSMLRMVTRERLSWLALAATVAAIVVNLTACSGDRTQVQASGPTITVGVAKVVKKSLGRQLTLSSELVPFQEIDVYAKESGYVKKLMVDYGTHVKAGEVMALLEIPDLEAQLQEDQAQIKNAANQVTRTQHELERYQAQYKALHLLTVAILSGVFIASLAIYPLLGLAFFPKTGAGQFTVNLKVPTGTRIEVMDQYVAKVEDLIRSTMEGKDLRRIVSNVGVVPDFSLLYTTNSGPYTATVQVQLNDSHRLSSFEYMDRVQQRMASQFPEIRTFFSSGSMVDAILNSGMPAPIDVQVSSSNLEQINGIAQNLS